MIGTLVKRQCGLRPQGGWFIGAIVSKLTSVTSVTSVTARLGPKARFAQAVWLGCILVALGAIAPAKADEIRPGYMEMSEREPGQWQLQWKLPLSIPPRGTLPEPQLPANCEYIAPAEMGIAAGAMTGSAHIKCAGSLGGERLSMPAQLVQSDILLRIAPLNAPTQAQRITPRERSVTITPQAGTWQVVGQYFIIGVEHILLGWDHLLFVIALVFLLREWRAVVGAATAFTVAHSITLAAASMGWFAMQARLVEALIALSIVVMAWEILRNKTDGNAPGLTRKYPWVIAFLFGLIHGFGFAGALKSIGLPEGDILWALLAFNLGVEAGQLAIVTALMVLLALGARYWPQGSGKAIRAASYGIGIIGCFWLIERVIG